MITRTMKFEVTLQAPAGAGVKEVADFIRAELPAATGGLVPGETLFGAFKEKGDVRVKRIFVEVKK